jgi:UDP:flavonoid glycosyltransferase YjiC (YdhE family)
VASLGELPENVRVTGWVPLGALVETCAAAIHHGGSGTTLTIVEAGIPQIVLPQGADQFVNAGWVRERGAGIVPESGVVDAGLVKQLLTDDTLGGAAAVLRAELHAMPSPASLVAKLEAFAS